jgi:Tol biopolymer transport system component
MSAMTGKALLSAGLIILSVLAAAPGAQAAFPGRNGSLVVERMVGDKQPDLFLMHPDGTAVQRLTATKAWEEKPEWSADGQQLVFSRSMPSGVPSEIATLSARDHALRVLTHFGSISAAPTFAPDGRVAFFSLHDFPLPTGDGPPPPAELYSIAPDGTKLRRLTSDRITQTDPEWSPDGTEIMFSRWRPIPHQSGVFDIGLSAIDPSGSNQRVIVPPSPQDIVTQDWSPDGRRILLEIATANPNGRPGHGARQSDLAVIDADGSHFRRLTRTAAIESMAVWSPDGKQIAFASDRQVKGNKDLPRGGRAFEIYTMSANGTHVRRVTRNHVPDLYPTWQPLAARDGSTADH